MLHNVETKIITFIDINEKLRRLKNKQSNFQNIAKIYFKHLNFEQFEITEFFQHLNMKNVVHLIQIFKFKNYLRFDEKHFIAIIIDN